MKKNKTLIIWLFNCFLASCSDCEHAAIEYREYKFNMILEKEPWYGRVYTLYGRNPITGYKEQYEEKGGFLYLDFQDLISVGDTLVKKQGELKVYIHKKDTVLIYNFKCDGKIYE